MRKTGRKDARGPRQGLSSFIPCPDPCLPGLTISGLINVLVAHIREDMSEENGGETHINSGKYDMKETEEW